MDVTRAVEQGARTVTAPPQADAADGDRDRRVEGEQVALLYGPSLASQIVTLANVTLVTFVLWNAADRATLLDWAVLMAVIAGARVLLTIAYRRTPAPVPIEPCRALFIAATGASGIGWGLAGLLLSFPTSRSSTRCSSPTCSAAWRWGPPR